MNGQGSITKGPVLRVNQTARGTGNKENGNVLALIWGIGCKTGSRRRTKQDGVLRGIRTPGDHIGSRDSNRISAGAGKGVGDR